jgi:hypothetical protein
VLVAPACPQVENLSPQQIRQCRESLYYDSGEQRKSQSPFRDLPKTVRSRIQSHAH